MNFRLSNFLKKNGSTVSSEIASGDFAELRAAIAILSRTLDDCRVELATVSAAKRSMDELWEERERKIAFLQRQVADAIAARLSLERSFRAYLVSEIEETRREMADLDRDISRIYASKWWQLKLRSAFLLPRGRPASRAQAKITSKK